MLTRISCFLGQASKGQTQLQAACRCCQALISMQIMWKDASCVLQNKDQLAGGLDYLKNLNDQAPVWKDFEVASGIGIEVSFWAFKLTRIGTEIWRTRPLNIPVQKTGQFEIRCSSLTSAWSQKAVAVKPCCALRASQFHSCPFNSTCYFHSAQVTKEEIEAIVSKVLAQEHARVEEDRWTSFSI